VSEIAFDEAEQRWVLTMCATTYAFCRDGGTFKHLYSAVAHRGARAGPARSQARAMAP
jgi:hypothetical protein